MLRLLVTVCVLAVVAVLSVSAREELSPRLAPAADTSQFRPGNIISDAVFYDSSAMATSQIQTFLNGQGANCRPLAGGPPCLKDFVQATVTRPADSFCPKLYSGAARETAAQIILNVSVACGINPRVILVTLQKEMGLVTSGGPTAKMYTRAMGYACPDTTGGTCDSTYDGFFNQVYSAAKQFQRYRANPTRYGHIPGMVNQIRFHPNAPCGSSAVRIENQATASLYNYTPYQPNAAALAAGYASASNPCSSYGNRNFWLYFTDWFGSTQTGGRDPDAPTGRVDFVGGAPAEIAVSGWAFDPNSPNTPISVHVYIDGRLAGALPTGGARPDVAAAYGGQGGNSGFSGSVTAEPGTRTACVYGVNIGPGWLNPLLGCRTVTVATLAAYNPTGTLDQPTITGTTVTATGWTVDPDAQSEPLSVHVYVDGAVVRAVTADQPSPAAAAAYPEAGSDHGYVWKGTLTPGSHHICTYAINKNRGTGNPGLGCRSVTVTSSTSLMGVPGGSPIGHLDGVAVSRDGIQVHGWAIDPEVPTAPVTIHMYIDGRVVAATRADRSRPDVGRVYPPAGDAHGFAWTGTVSAGRHEVCAYAINLGPAAPNPRLGCRTVIVTTTTPSVPPTGGGSPFGHLDAVGGLAGAMTLGGWTIDPDVPTTPLQVHVYIDGRVAFALTASQPRSDVGRVYPTAGSAHGYAWTGSAARGRHEVCVWAINQGVGGNMRLGCKTVTVT